MRAVLALAAAIDAFWAPRVAFVDGCLAKSRRAPVRLECGDVVLERERGPRRDQAAWIRTRMDEFSRRESARPEARVVRTAYHSAGLRLQTLQSYGEGPRMAQRTIVTDGHRAQALTCANADARGDRRADCDHLIHAIIRRHLWRGIWPPLYGRPSVAETDEPRSIVLSYGGVFFESDGVTPELRSVRRGAWLTLNDYEDGRWLMRTVLEDGALRLMETTNGCPSGVHDRLDELHDDYSERRWDDDCDGVFDHLSRRSFVGDRCHHVRKRLAGAPGRRRWVVEYDGVGSCAE